MKVSMREVLLVGTRKTQMLDGYFYMLRYRDKSMNLEQLVSECYDKVTSVDFPPKTWTFVPVHDVLEVTRRKTIQF